jgi:cytochrome c oxidase assembly protein subunit 11
MRGSSGNGNRRVAVMAIAGGLAMLGLTYASVPLYSLFCKATGYGGTPRRADAAPAKTGDRVLTIRFDANTAGSLGWNFHPEQPSVNVKVGEQTMATYAATNLSQRRMTGTAVYNVVPESAAAYFNKIQCFCFTEQTLNAGESAELPVVFFVDPAIADDPDTKSITEITLSYTFYPVDKPKTVSQVQVTGAAKTN